MNRFFGRYFIVLSLGLLVAGCATAEQRTANYKERCAARGLQPNTDAFDDCVAQIESARETRMDARRREMTETPPPPPIQQR